MSTETISCQAGFLPVPLASIPTECLTDLDIYLANSSEYYLYRGVGVRFEEDDRDRLLANDIKFAYVSTADHEKYYQTIEAHLDRVINCPTIKQQQKSEILYSTCTELAHQLLKSPPGPAELKRADNLSHAVVEMVMRDENAFSRLFEVSSHDFYTSTHLVNTCTYATALAHHMQIQNEEFLKNLALGALLHDIGKMFIPSHLLNSTEDLSEKDFDFIREHVQLGCDHLKKTGNLHPQIMQAAAEHHERIDGSGYPHGLMGDQISLSGRIIAVIDTFDAMTCVRPYRAKSHSVEKTLDYLTENSPEKFDREVVVAFVDMIKKEMFGVQNGGKDNLQWPVPENSDKGSNGQARRRHERHYFRKVASMMTIDKAGGQLKLGSPCRITIHNISRSGMGFITPQPLPRDANVCIVIPGPDNTEPIKFVAVVIHSYSHDDGWHTIGARFYNLQSAKILEQLVKQSAMPSR